MTTKLEESPDAGVNIQQHDSEQVLSCLSDPYCRRLIEAAEEPKSAMELSDECGIAESTVYMKLKELVECSLVEKGYQIDAQSGYRARYVTDFQRVAVRVEDDYNDLALQVTVVEG